MKRAYRHRRGLSMIEVVVAIALLGTGIAACVACIGSATQAAGRAEEFTAVQLLAREKLAELELQGGQEGEASGDFGEQRSGFGWQTVITPADVPGLKQVRLRVLWGDSEKPRSVEYVTFIRKGTR